ncbi:hypothetical protein DFH06DRAFT_1166597 [Mycena polygramma]|nr:hypothetical protein DFH06DRAFT_1166597 [Mycena polygramma]
MDASTHTDEGFISHSTLEDSESTENEMFSSEQDSEQTDAIYPSSSTTENAGSASLGSASFSNAYHFTVSGGAFTNVTNNYGVVSTVVSDYRSIRLGDIDLKELRLETPSQTLGYLHKRRSTRRVYTARVDGRKSNVTVAIYEGKGGEEDWREDISRYSCLRHPSIFQLWGITTSSHIHAAIFHDDLIPWEYFPDLHRDSPISVVYIYGYCGAEYLKTLSYLCSTFEYPYGWTLWIRASTGRLCVDPVESERIPFIHLLPLDLPAPTSLNAPRIESMALSLLTLEQYHEIASYHLPQHRNVCVSTSVILNSGAILCWAWGSQLKDSVQLASVPDVEIFPRRWSRMGSLNAVESGDVVENGWTRYHSDDIRGSFLESVVYPGDDYVWLSQANHIFTRLRITSNLEHYCIVNRIAFHVGVSWTPQNCLNGYLFLCPPTDLKTGPSSYRWPHCPAYWTQDPSGIDRLSPQEATRLGFPSIDLKTRVTLMSWDASVYAGLRQFHKGKGLDPDSQDVARHLGYPLYQFNSEIERQSGIDDPPTFWADEDDWNLDFVALESEEPFHENRDNEHTSVMKNPGGRNKIPTYTP